MVKVDNGLKSVQCYREKSSKRFYVPFIGTVDTLSCQVSLVVRSSIPWGITPPPYPATTPRPLF